MNTIDKLITKEIIFEKSEFKDTDVAELVDLLNEAKKEIKLYVSSLSGVDTYVFSLRLPTGDNITARRGNTSILDNEIVYLPYGSFSLKLFLAMKADGDNCPVFKLVNYFSENVDKLCKLLINAGVVDAKEPELLITRSMLNNAGIVDILNLHTCITIYFNFFKEV